MAGCVHTSHKRDICTYLFTSTRLHIGMAATHLTKDHIHRLHKHVHDTSAGVDLPVSVEGGSAKQHKVHLLDVAHRHGNRMQGYLEAKGQVPVPEVIMCPSCALPCSNLLIAA
eukprot:scaffold82022_cov19-Tisochrysis_lutea.AAC.2